MRKLLLLSTILLSIEGCTVNKKPVFKYIDSINVKNVSLRNVTLKANALFENPNHLKGKISIDDIHVFVDNIDMGIVSSQEFNVPAKGKFKIPIEGTFSLSKIYEDNKKGILGSVLKIIQTDSLLIQYKGNIKYHLRGFSFPYKIDKSQKVSLK